MTHPTGVRYLPRIGEIVLWYESANTGRDSRPVPAIVTEASSNGALDLSLFHRGALQVTVKSAVYHVSTEIHWDKNGNPTSAAIRNGGWDYLDPPVIPAPAPIPDLPPTAREAVMPPIPAIQNETNADRIRKLLAEGKSVDEVAKVMRRWGATKSEVEEIAASVAAATT